MPRLTMMMLALSTAVCAYATPQATPGQWEISSKMSMQGMAMQIPAHSMKICIKPEDAKNVEKQTFAGPGGKPNKDCKMLENTVSGDTVKFHLKCEGEHQADVNGEVSYSGDSYQGKTTINATGPQGKMQMVNTFTAKRLGDCK